MRFSFLISLLTLVTCESEDFDPFTECLVPDLNVACTNRCEINSLDCFAECDSNDTVCWSQCLRENTECINNCPCEVNCLDGCDDCENSVCTCQVIEENPDWNRCIDENSLKLGRCVHSCENNQECENNCLNTFKTRQVNCPCEENCSAGCPCSDFDCLAPTSVPSTTITTSTTTSISPTGNAVLVLSSLRSWPSGENNKLFIVDLNGNINEDLNFEYGDDVDVYEGCGATLQNVFWYFGGDELHKRRVSKIVGCKLERQTDLNFDFSIGACNTFHQPDQKVLLCFDLNYDKQCHTFDGESYQSAGSSAYSHALTGIANYRGKALATGCWESWICGKKTELMDMNTLTWSRGPDYPYTFLYYYSTVSTSEAAYIIGGYYWVQDTSEVIVEFKDNNWRQIGRLATGRSGHGSIILNGETMVIGGDPTKNTDAETEIWNFTNGDHKNQFNLPIVKFYGINGVTFCVFALMGFTIGFVCFRRGKRLMKRRQRLIEKMHLDNLNDAEKMLEQMQKSLSSISAQQFE